MRYLLNSAVITAPGFYRYRLVTIAEARANWGRGQVNWQSTIGYATTAELLSALLGVPVAVNSVPCTMQPGDEALVCRFAPGQRLDRRLKSGQEGRAWAEEQFIAGNFELGVLRREE